VSWLFPSLRGYRRDWLRVDVLAGLTTSIRCARSTVSTRASSARPMVSPRALGELAEDLKRDGVELLLARDVGQVRDVLRAAADESLTRVYPSVRAAVDSLRVRRQ
jgi:predicted RecB family endonuclease